MPIDFATVLDGARTLARVDEIARALWAVYGAGEIGDGDAEAIGARIEEARLRIRPNDTVKVRAPGVALAAVSMFPPRRRRCVSPDRAASRERRRRLAYSGPLPPALAAGFTTGQLAALRIVADEIRARGACVLALCEIAARAGVGVTTARNALRLAAGDGLLLVVERRRHGAPSLPNVVRIISREWLAWIARASRGEGPTEQTPRIYSSKLSGSAESQRATRSADRTRPPADRLERKANGRSGFQNRNDFVLACKPERQKS